MNYDYFNARFYCLNMNEPMKNSDRNSREHIKRENMFKIKNRQQFNV